MDNAADEVLPYRTTGEDLVRLIEARARGRDLSQIRSLNYSKKTFNGSLLAAEKFGFVNSETEELTEAGRQFALCKPDERKEALLKAALNFEPYDLLLEAAFGRSEEETELDWIETWWSTHNFGSSGTNRSDASTSFAKLLEYIGLGEYIVGRHSKSSRIKWAEDAEGRIESARKAHISTNERKPQSASKRSKRESEEKQDRESLRGAGEQNNVFSLSFDEDQKAELSLPAKLKPEEKERLVELVRLMVATDDGDSEVQMNLNL